MTPARGRWLHREGRIRSGKVRQSVAIAFDQSVNFFAVDPVVGFGYRDLSRCEATLVTGAVGAAQGLDALDQLPDVEGSADHPGPSIPVVAPERDTREPAHPHGLLGEILQDRSLAALGASRLLGDGRIQGRGEPDAERDGAGHGYNVSQPFCQSSALCCSLTSIR